jgi:hypothetical protein
MGFRVRKTEHNGAKHGRGALGAPSMKPRARAARFAAGMPSGKFVRARLKPERRSRPPEYSHAPALGKGPSTGEFRLLIRIAMSDEFEKLFRQKNAMTMVNDHLSAPQETHSGFAGRHRPNY